MADGDTGVNALIGAAVAVVFAFLPLSTVLGGAVAGYLQRGDDRNGAVVGALSGLIAMLPIVGLGTLFGGLLFMGPAAGMPIELATLGYLLLVVAFGVALVYFVAFGAIGGVLGGYLAREIDV